MAAFLPHALWASSRVPAPLGMQVQLALSVLASTCSKLYSFPVTLEAEEAIMVWWTEEQPPKILQPQDLYPINFYGQRDFTDVQGKVGEVILDYLGGPDIVTRVLTRGMQGV